MKALQLAGAPSAWGGAPSARVSRREDAEQYSAQGLELPIENVVLNSVAADELPVAGHDGIAPLIVGHRLLHGTWLLVIAADACE
ncbi:hypothetical protein [Saccharopolyspora phatthalungensis]|uniref:Uncharacterized protein n=1 Tax=Saccharopolyspora phatthalungensis TaxID=664693 RepID=A0A840QK96_9PSEU|nr:hypothetical protein [Saccharopolyspora phatthalungensis]MBB5160048.1 hypothetical protein [Saccharopolyspora phatthalungensis]